MRTLFFWFSIIIVSLESTFSQVLDPVKWSYSVEKINDAEYYLVFNARIDEGWHLYGLNMPEDGPYPTSFNFNKSDNFTVSDKPLAVIKPRSALDPILEMQVELLEEKGLFKQKIRRTTDQPFQITGYVEFMACNDRTCTPPIQKNFDFSIEKRKTTAIKTITDSIAPEMNLEEGLKDSSVKVSDSSLVSNAGTDTPTSGNEENKTPLGILILSVLAGLGALLTPCVYPMIPLTVSYFIRGNKSKSTAILQALIFGISIVLIYTLLGVLVAAFKDPNAVNTVSTNWILNLVFFIIFILLAASFFGMFELVLPSALANKIDEQADRGGYLGAFFMALGMVILSFSCTGPIVASLLIKASEGEVLEPVLGMFGFGLIFAIPFTLFAVFPSWLKSLPKSGSWLNSIKVFMAFILLAFSFYFLSKIDQVYHLNLIPRELYIGFWIVVFTLLGFYLLGKIKFPHDSNIDAIGVPRFLLAVVVFTFVLYLIPGIFGAPLKGISPLLPPVESQSFTINEPVVPSSDNFSNELCNSPKYSDFLQLPLGLKGYFDYDEAIACAKEKGKPVLIDFVGHACANCKKMYQNVWSDDKVLTMLKEKFILVALYTDDRTKLSENEWFTSKIDGRLKNTVGRKNVDFQIEKFNSNALPLYAIVNADGEVITSAPYYVYDPDIEKFIKFLEDGLSGL